MRRWSCHRREGLGRHDQTTSALEVFLFLFDLSVGFGASFSVAGAWFVLFRGLCVLCYSPDGPLSSNRKVHFLKYKKTCKREQFIFFWYSRQSRVTVLL